MKRIKSFSLLSVLFVFIFAQSAFALNSVIFDKAGDYIWVVPSDVTEIMVSAAAGGAGAGYYSPEMVHILPLAEELEIVF